MTDVTPSQASTSRDRMRSHRARKKYGLVTRRLLVSRTQLDKLEEGGYLNPGDRDNRADECEAIASFLTDFLAKSS